MKTNRLSSLILLALTGCTFVEERPAPVNPVVVVPPPAPAPAPVDYTPLVLIFGAITVAVILIVVMLVIMQMRRAEHVHAEQMAMIEANKPAPRRVEPLVISALSYEDAADQLQISVREVKQLQAAGRLVVTSSVEIPAHHRLSPPRGDT